jgi:hypothetical protein
MKNEKLLEKVADGVARYCTLQHYQQGSIISKTDEKIDQFQLLLSGTVVSFIQKSSEEISLRKSQLT